MRFLCEREEPLFTPLLPCICGREGEPGCRMEHFGSLAVHHTNSRAISGEFTFYSSGCQNTPLLAPAPFFLPK
jgi:hypothetical protein